MPQEEVFLEVQAGTETIRVVNYRADIMIPIIDIFAGAGGLGEGFSSFTDENGNAAFKIRLSIEKEFHAHQTLLLRAFFRQFSKSSVPDDYYEVLKGKLKMSALFEKFGTEAEKAKSEAIQATLGQDAWASVSATIKKALAGEKNWLLIGGPPCQAYSLVGRARNKGNKKYSAEEDGRHFLYKEYLRILANFWPAVFVMENVKGLLSSVPDPTRDPIFKQITADLIDPATAVGDQVSSTAKRFRYKLYSLSPSSTSLKPVGHDFVLRAEDHGVPQARHRVIVIGVRDDLTMPSPPKLKKELPVPISKVLKTLPAIRSGVSDTTDSEETWLALLIESADRRWFQSMDTKGGDGLMAAAICLLEKLDAPKSGRGGEFIAGTQKINYQPEWYLDERLGGVCNHASRAHITKDLYRYFYAACFAQLNGRSPKLGEFPKDLLPNHKNVDDAITEGNMFLDRFRVQPWGRPSTTVTSHISKDGHYYIHPDPKQCRSLTVREAARLQTFPDNYFFTGPRTAQYTQVGNAVPPLLATRIAESIFSVFPCANSGE